MVIKLKTALSKTLTQFYPLAGRLSKNPNTIDCFDQGVQFLVARADSNLADILNSPIIKELDQLALVESSYIEQQLTIQVTLLHCGGIAVGVSLSHRIMDGCSISCFLSNWFGITKGSEIPLMGPVLDSAVLFPPTESFEFPTTRARVKNLVTKRFVFSSSAINKLKREVVESNSTLVNPTRVEVVTAFIWKCASNALGGFKTSVAFNMVNLRKKMVPLLQDYQFGNLFQLATAVTHDQTAEIADLVLKIRDSVKKIDSEYLTTLTGEKGPEIAKNNFSQIRKFMIQEGARKFKFSSTCRLTFNQSDFGWGKPVWLSIANLDDENVTVLQDSKLDDVIEAWVGMNEVNMQKFEQSAELQAFVGYQTQLTRPSCRL